ncbi:hypothetical protein BJV77DRAFT_1069105 [Russula vinacea]|nr:hypothetical protein BJV77DRAFT_1069105 [Russula vinacea]
MVNYKDPATIAKDSEVVVKLWHVTNGIYIWEFFTTLYYEWDVIRDIAPTDGRYGFVYSLARVNTLLSVILNIVGFDSTGKINCQVWVSFLAIFSSTAFVSATLLIVLRVCVSHALLSFFRSKSLKECWQNRHLEQGEDYFCNRNGYMVTETSLFLLATIRLRSSWSPEANACIMTNFDSTKYSSISSLSSDLALLIIMLIGLLRLRCEGGGVFALGRTLWKQGLIWLLLATIAELPPVVFFILNLNDNPKSWYGHSDNFCNEAVSLSHKHLLFQYSFWFTRESPRNWALSVRHTGPAWADSARPDGGLRAHGIRPVFIVAMGRSGASITDPEVYKAHEVSFNVDVESGLEEK